MLDHRVSRAMERYAIPFSKADVFQLEREIAEGRSVLIEKRPSAELHVVKHGDLPMVCIVNGNGVILTFLPREAILRRGHALHYGGTKKQVHRRRMKAHRKRQSEIAREDEFPQI